MRVYNMRQYKDCINFNVYYLSMEMDCQTLNQSYFIEFRVTIDVVFIASALECVFQQQQQRKKWRVNINIFNYMSFIFLLKRFDVTSRRKFIGWAAIQLVKHDAITAVCLSSNCKFFSIAILLFSFLLFSNLLPTKGKKCEWRRKWEKKIGQRLTDNNFSFENGIFSWSTKLLLFHIILKGMPNKKQRRWNVMTKNGSHTAGVCV